jgi:hypothetical protein
MATRRQRIRTRAKGLCEYCRLAESHTNLPHEVDHIRAKKHLGQTTLANTCWACAYCNSAKGTNVAGFDPLTDQLVPLFNPRLDDWEEHFTWDGPILVGRTAIGRATIAVLGINRDERVAHRRLLMDSGEEMQEEVS